MPFEKGHKLAKGRPKGSENEITKKFKTVREVVLDTFHKIQENPMVRLEQFAIDNPRDFYNIAAKLIPAEVHANIELTGIKQIIIEPASKDKGK